MFKYLRIAILPFVAAAIMPIPRGLAEDIGSQPQILTARPLIRVADQQCRRDCDATYAACLSEVRMAKQQGLSKADSLGYIDACIKQHEACYRAC